jgi:hypothetical protein
MDYNQQSYSSPPVYQDRPQAQGAKSDDSLYTPRSEYPNQPVDQKRLTGSNAQYYQQREAGYVVPENERYEDRRERSPLPGLMKMAQEMMGKK